MSDITSEDLARLEALLAKATPGPYRAHDHNDMAEHDCDPEKWIGYAWVGRHTQYSTADGRFDGMWLDLDSRGDASKEWRERMSGDAHFVAAALNALPALIAAARRAEALEAALTLSTETKSEYMGEFSMTFPAFDDNGEEYLRSINIPWTSIKVIMATIRAFADLGARQ